MEFLKKLFLLIFGLAVVAFIAWLVFPGVSTIGTGEHKPVLVWLKEDVLGIPKCGIFGGGCSNGSGGGTISNNGSTANIQIVNPSIHVSNLPVSAILQNGLTVTGQAKYSWFYQNVALGRVTDEKGTEIGAFQIKTLVKASADSFVPFTGQIFFSQPQTKTGYVIFDKANPSADPKKRSSLYIPIVFSGTNSGTTNSYFNQTAFKSCRVTGCSGEICSDKEVMSTCVYRPEFACYQQAKCELQQDGNCGFTLNAAVNTCIANSRSNPATRAVGTQNISR